MNYYVKIFYQEVSLWERSHNEGSIRERKDGKFEMRVKLLHKIEYNIHISEMVDPTSTKLIDWMKI